MSKMQHFSNKSSKVVKRWGLSAPSLLNLQCWWHEVAWFGQIVFFQTDYDKIGL